MATEIERKFLVNSNAFLHDAIGTKQIEQGYLSLDPDRTVRVRVYHGSANYGEITIKGRSSDDGLIREEHEMEIPSFDMAQSMMNMCIARIKKQRHYAKVGQPGGPPSIFEVDVFLDANGGLIVAEIELPTPDAEFYRPSWLGKEVTGDPKYYNSSLSTHPYAEWSDSEKYSELFFEDDGCGSCNVCNCGL